MPKKRKNFRLPNGAGSVYKLPGNRRNPWTAVMHCGYKDDGRVIRKYIGYYPTQEEALHALEMYKETPFDLGNKNMTVERLFSLLMERKKDKSRNTINVYKTSFRHLAALHNQPIRQLKTHHWQKVFDDMTISPKSKQPIKAVVSMLYSLAIELEICNKDYGKFLNIGKIEKSTLHKPFTDLEVRKLRETVNSDARAKIPLILIYTGMRPQELLNVRIEDVNLEDGYIVGGLKTEAGRNRIIPIHHYIKPIIADFCKKNNSYLIQGKRGGKLYYSQIFKEWSELMSSLGFDHTPHDGRHTFISHAKRRNLDPLTLKRIVGHSSQDLTEEVYTHIEAEHLVEAVNQL